MPNPENDRKPIQKRPLFRPRCPRRVTGPWSALTAAAVLSLLAATARAQDECTTYGLVGDKPVVGDWNGDGKDEIGIFRGALWDLDFNGNGVWDGSSIDRSIVFGLAGDIPVVGDWNGDGRDDIGIVRNATWHLDLNGNGDWDGCGADQCAEYGLVGDIPVVGDWNGDGRDQIGILRGSIWAFDSNGDFTWQTGDVGSGFGIPGDTPMPADWNGDGRDEIAIFRPPNIWSIDLNGNNVWDQVPPDDGIFFANGDGVPVVGNWDGVGGDSAGMYTGAFWSLDGDGDGRWDGCNQPPVAVNDSAETIQGQEVLIEVLNNDFDPDGDELHLPPNTTVSGPSHGSAGRISSTVMRYTPNASFIDVDSFEYRVHDEHGAEAIARVWVTVHAPTAPEISSIGPDIIPHESTTQITVTGINFEDPTVYVGTENPTVAGRVFPTATLLSVNGAGTSIEVRIDATAPGIEGWYTLYVETASGGIAGIFRVVPNEPVVDAWSPVEAATGNTYILTILGANLEGATVTPSDPHVHVLDLDNSDDEALEGLLFVDNGAPIGDGDLTIHGGGGGVSIPLQLLTDPQSATLRTREIVGVSTSLDSSGDTGTKEEPSAPSGPPILMQELSYAPGVQREEAQVTTGKISSQAASMAGLCFTFRITRGRSSSRTIVTLFNLDTGRPLTQAALNALSVGDRLNIGSTVLFTWRKWFGIAEISYCINGGVDGSVCIAGELGAIVPLVGGQVFRFDACFGLDGPPMITLSASGEILNFEWSSDCNCVTVFDLFPSSRLGTRFGELEVLDCGEAGLSVISDGTVGNPFSTFPAEVPIFIEGEIARFAPENCPTSSPVLRIFLDVDDDNDFGPGAVQLSDIDDLPKYVPGSALSGESVAPLPQTIFLVGAYVEANGSSVTVVPPPLGVNSLSFELVKPSAFRGIAMNFPFGGAGEDNFDFDFGSGTDGGTGDPPSTTAAFGGDHLARAALNVFDYGGFTLVEAKPLGSLLPGVEVRIPEDDDGNLLPDAGWSTSSGTVMTESLAAEDDVDSQPTAGSLPLVGWDGDGLSNYEEYRGFIVFGQHVRTHPDRKDFFVRREDIGFALSAADFQAVGVGFFGSSGLEMHEIFGIEWNGGATARRDINFNYVNSAAFGVPSEVPGRRRQSAIRLIFEDVVSANSVLGRTDTQTGEPAIPTQVRFAQIRVNKIEELGGHINQSSSFVLDMIRHVTAHELGHSVHVCHRGPVPGGAPEDCPDSASVVVSPLVPSRMFNMHSGIAQDVVSPSINPSRRVPSSFHLNSRDQIRLHLFF